MFSALAYVPPNNAIRYFELLIDEICNNFNVECDDLIYYFEDTYISICFIKFVNDIQGLCTTGGGLLYKAKITF